MKVINRALIKAAELGDKLGLDALLLSLGCDPASKDKYGKTALMWAAHYGHASCTELLIPVSDALAKTRDDWTALMYAAFNGQASCVQLLMPVSDVVARDNDGHAAGELARNQGHASLAAFIDAYNLALGEMLELGSLVAQGRQAKRHRFVCSKR